MPKFKFAKLVRDDIVTQQIASGAKSSYRQLSPSEHRQELVNKIIEESREITHAPIGEVAAELADVQQALDDLKEQYGLSSQEIAEAQAIKTKKNGAFKKGLFVDYVEVDETNAWFNYYRENPDRYPEIE